MNTIYQINFRAAGIDYTWYRFGKDALNAAIDEIRRVSPDAVITFKTISEEEWNELKRS